MIAPGFRKGAKPRKGPHTKSFSFPLCILTLISHINHSPTLENKESRTGQVTREKGRKVEREEGAKEQECLEKHLVHYLPFLPGGPMGVIRSGKKVPSE